MFRKEPENMSQCTCTFLTCKLETQKNISVLNSPRNSFRKKQKISLTYERKKRTFNSPNSSESLISSFLSKQKKQSIRNYFSPDPSPNGSNKENINSLRIIQKNQIINPVKLSQKTATLQTEKQQCYIYDKSSIEQVHKQKNQIQDKKVKQREDLKISLDFRTTKYKNKNLRVNTDNSYEKIQDLKTNKGSIMKRSQFDYFTVEQNKIVEDKGDKEGQPAPWNENTKKIRTLIDLNIKNVDSSGEKQSQQHVSIAMADNSNNNSGISNNLYKKSLKLLTSKNI